MRLSLQLIKEVLKEARLFPRHALRVVTAIRTEKAFTYEKYTFGKHRKQYLCWFTSQEALKNEIIIFFHGGGWTFGTPETFSNRAKLFTDYGYQVIMPSHRKLPFNSYKEIREDLILTLQKTHEIMAEKGMLHKKIILGGMSSGGNLAALLFFDHTLLENTPFSIGHFKAAFLCAPPVNLAGMTDSFVLELYAGKRDTETFKMASPIHHLPTIFSKPLLLIHGTEDGLVSYKSTVEFVKLLQNKSTISIDFHTIKGGSHIDAVSWAYKENAIRKRILEWLGEL